MPVYWLESDSLSFPPVERAFPDGLLAVGGDLSINRLLVAYSQGIFPWFNPQDPILWWSPDPRLVLFPKNLHVAKSMRVYFNRQLYQVTFNRHFEKVMQTCGEISRKNQEGSWIHDDMIEAYSELHRAGYAHSVEVWDKDQLVGGVYGVALGKVFFGESMFALKPNASKFGFISLVKILAELDFTVIDCQQETAHLQSLGAESISRDSFTEILKTNKELYSFEKLILQ
ncbi:MAG: leucyl/phenylalanyl-tRNA--protein transferase [Saprospiraceae bacterium]|mgnify:CR=1 FL=1|jgi:leucyl/phenylalanyl-tRNA--protein transferase|nr:leucyl/phenylalanyl-tRNA--protein transferase [Saprospiraceae bacterium]